MFYKKIMIIFIMVFFFTMTCQASPDGRVYHLKFNWKSEKNLSKFYDVTTYLYERLKMNNVFLYSEFGNLNGIDIFLGDPISASEFEILFSKMKNASIEIVFGDNLIEEQVLRDFFITKTYNKDIFSCEIRYPMNSIDSEAPMRYVTLIQKQAQRRGHMLAMTFVWHETYYQIVYSFYANCNAKEEIKTELLKIFP